MRIGSLFSGYGGLDLAAQQYFGGHLTWYSEIEPAACQILTAHHPFVPNLGDITAIDWATVKPVDVLTGGYPCQPFSHAGKRKGKSDERHLWPFVAIAIDALRPRVVVLENVRGHLTLGFGDVLADLSRMGYDARWGVVRASDAGAPHGRARVFIVAYPDGTRLQGAGAGVDMGAGRDNSGGHLASGSDCAAPDASSRSLAGSGATGDRLCQPSQRSNLAIEHAKGEAGRESGDSGSRTQVFRGADRGTPPDTSGSGSRAFGPQRPSETGSAARLNGDSEPPCDASGDKGWISNGDSEPPPDADGDRHGQQLHPRRVGGVEGEAEGEPRQRERPRRVPDSGGDLPPADAGNGEWEIDAGDDGIDGQRSTQRWGSVVAAGAGGSDVDYLGALARPHAATGEPATGHRRAPADGDGEPSGDTNHGTQQQGVTGIRLPDALGRTEWGKYEPAISRWEQVLGRVAPDPTVPGTNGRPRLSPLFVEWMMGLDLGHVTGHGLRPAQELKALGNGVCPQQAHLALRMILGEAS